MDENGVSLRRPGACDDGGLHDGHDLADAGTTLALPSAPALCATRLPYVFAGSAELGETELATRESLPLSDERYMVEAHADTDPVLLNTDSSASVFAGGMFSGNVLSWRQEE